MRQIPENASADTARTHLRYLKIRLGGRDETKAFLAPIEAALADLAKADEAWQDARLQRQAATNDVVARDAELDATIGALAREVRMVVEGNPADPRYAKLFPIAPSKGMSEVGGDGQARFVQAILARLADDADLAQLQSRAAGIKAALDACIAAVKKRDALYVPEGQASVDRRHAIDDARRLHVATYHQLQLLYPGQDSLVESFFYRPNSTSTSSSTEEMPERA